MMYAVLHPPNFAVQAAAHGRPELRKLPLALLDGESPAETVFAANKAALSLGVEVGMTRLQAESYPGVATIPRILEHESSAHTTFHTIACTFSPRIEYVETHPGTFALDIQGMNTLYGDAAQLASKLRQRIMAAGFLANVAVAQNFHAAVCLAYGRTGVSVVPPGDEASALGHLPLHVLNLAPAHEEIFQSWGIRTCAELAALSETDLIARIGQAGKRLHSLARGEWPHLMFPIEPSFEAGLMERMELDFPVEMLGVAALPARPDDRCVAGACEVKGACHRICCESSSSSTAASDTSALSGLPYLSRTCPRFSSCCSSI